ncbi:hypothetical protein [Bacillus suaedae]|nr:hypothetical protein [Bacillus suaedae]
MNEVNNESLSTFDKLFEYGHDKVLRIRYRDGGTLFAGGRASYGL